MLRCSPRQSHVARGKKLQVAEPGARQAERLLGFHQEERSLAHLHVALRALSVAQNLDDDRLWNAIQLFLELLLLALREGWRYVVRRVVCLDRRVSALTELQGYGPGPRSAHVASFTWLQALFPSPTPEYFHGRRDLVEISLNHSLQAIHPPFAPGIDVHGQQESHSAKHVNRADVLLTRQRGFRSPNYALFQPRLTIGIRHTIQDNKDTAD